MTDAIDDRLKPVRKILTDAVGAGAARAAELLPPAYHAAGDDILGTVLADLEAQLVELLEGSGRVDVAGDVEVGFGVHE